MLLLFAEYPQHAEGRAIAPHVTVQALLLGHEVQEPIKVHLLHCLRGSPGQLRALLIPLRVGIDAGLDRGLGFGRSKFLR